jgi:hypothetical protein
MPKSESRPNAKVPSASAQKGHCLVISNHSSSIAACHSLDKEASRFRPLELLRALEFDRIIEDIK